MRNKRGITLIALVITIVILLILAGILITQLVGNGLFDKVKLAKEKSEQAQKDENIALQKYENVINEYLVSSDRNEKCEHISENIEDFTPNIDFINGTYITISVPEITTKNSVEIAGYIFLFNGKVKGFTIEKTFTFGNLEFDTSYDIEVIAVDDNSKIKSAKISEKTLNKLYLYKEGNECNYITGGWKNSGYDGNNTGTFTKNKDHMYLYAPNGSRLYCSQTKSINLTDFSKLYIESENPQGIRISQTSYYSNVDDRQGISYNNMEPVNISEYNGNYYIHWTVANNSYCKIKNVWLEK